ncbi:hypothetical protein BC830DRAFT_1137389 [Chytriomyces sp. MP71]|nr:hypothetical protein BC830DRAFT_1137389 [Chytriomyces sp. MP71]
MSRIPARPKKEEHFAELDAIKAKIETLQKKMSALQATINGTDNIKGTYDSKIKELREKLDVLAKERKQVNDDRNKHMDRIKALSAGIKKKNDDAKSAKDSAKTVTDIDAKINNMESQISSGNLTMNEEKRLVTEISSLKKQRKTLESAPAGSAASTVEADKAEIDALKAQLDLLKPRKDDINAQYDVVKADLTTQDGGKKKDLDSFNGLLTQKKALKAEIDGLYESQRTLREDFKRRNDEWFAATKAEREKRDQEYKDARKAEQAERLKMAAAQKLEDAEIPAFTEEIANCNTLIAFLSQYSATAVKAAVSASAETASAFAATNIRKVDDALPQGAVALKKKDDREEDFFMGGGKKGKGAKKSNGTTPSTLAVKAFKVDLASLDMFSKLQLDIPTSAADVDASIAAIEAKKVQFLDEQAAQTLKNKEAAQAEVERLQKLAEESGDFESAAAELEGDVVVENA